MINKSHLKYFVIIFLGSISLNAQNLILNPSFEEYADCPTQNDQLSFCKNWINPTKSSPDYFNNCGGVSLSNKTIAGVPYNFGGYKNPHYGNAYTGIILCSLDPTYKEYVQTKLKSKLMAEQQYQFSFWISLADSSIYQANGICICFSEDAKLSTGDVNDGGIMLSCKNKGRWIEFNKSTTGNKDWIQIKGKFEASGNEEYLTIGVFKENVKIKIKKVNKKEKVKKTHKPYAYYYIDDVELTPVATKGIE